MAEYEKIIDDLGHQLHFPLQLEKGGAVVILVEEVMPIQIELEPEGRYLVIAATITDLSPGPLREKILKNALKANASPHPRYGTFAYSKQANQLVLFDRLRIEELTGDLLFHYLEPFAEKGWAWADGIHRGLVPEPTVRKAAVRPKLSTGGADGH